MKKLTLISLLSFLAAVLLLAGCAGRNPVINIDADGYGKATMSNGMIVLVNRDESTSLTAGRILIGGGVLTETAENNGITNLMTKMLLKGNDAMTASEITEQLDFLGASFSADCYRDYSSISFTCLTENFEQVLDIISRSLTSPTFPDDELQKLKMEIQGDIKASDDNQAAASSKLFWKTTFGNEGYGLPTTGTEESIKNITIDDIKAHYRKLVGANNIIFSVATDLLAEKLSTIIGSKLGSIKSGAETLPAPSLNFQNEKTGFISYDRNQSFVYMGYVMNHLQPKEMLSVFLLHEIMGNNVGSRLWYLRQEEKLAYSVYTQYAADKYESLFRAAIGTDTSKVKQALGSLEREWDKLVSDGITAEELVDAKINLKNNLIFYIDRKSGRANYMASFEYAGYGYKFILDMIAMADSIALDDVNSFIMSNLTSDRRYTSIVGKQ
ncbi:MAG: pitrilysin family protein [Candidatus Zixiibacteriota bacterium]